jgi:two-component system, OmpR family, sensor histidine kinase CiaH
VTASTQDVRRLSIRTALGATAAVGVIYLLIAIAVVSFATSQLTGQIDARLASTLQHFSSAPWPVGGPTPPQGERPLGPVRAFWGLTADGRVVTDQEDLLLPEAFQEVTSPQTIQIDGYDIRIAGAALGPNHIVVGESLDPVNAARSTIVLGELIIAPILLLAVFAGAFLVGRRVATPIERARRRQLEFTADASHELRTPLSVIEAHTTLALAQEREAAWYRNAFRHVDDESKRMRRLLDDLLWLARFDATKAPPNAEPVDLGVLAIQAADRFRVVAEARHLRLDVRADPSGVIVGAPPEWLDRLLGVLLDNACKYSPDGASVDVRVTSDGSRVRLVVDDAGPGIPADERDHIFDRFHRASEGPGGAGLGLAIADAIVRATGGRWQVESSPAGGARMAVSWPRALPDRREPAPGAATTPIVEQE